MNKLKKQVSRFLVAGFSAVATDLIIYYSLLRFISYTPAKAISFLSGTMVAYVINKYWTFGKMEKSLKEVLSFLILYLFTLFVNVTINGLSLVVLPHSVSLAFLVATGSSTILNFLGQKFFVFKN